MESGSKAEGFLCRAIVEDSGAVRGVVGVLGGHHKGHHKITPQEQQQQQQQQACQRQENQISNGLQHSGNEQRKV